MISRWDPPFSQTVTSNEKVDDTPIGGEVSRASAHVLSSDGRKSVTVTVVGKRATVAEATFLAREALSK